MPCSGRPITGTKPLLTSCVLLMLTAVDLLLVVTRSVGSSFVQFWNHFPFTVCMLFTGYLDKKWCLLLSKVVIRLSVNRLLVNLPDYRFHYRLPIYRYFYLYNETSGRSFIFIAIFTDEKIFVGICSSNLREPNTISTEFFSSRCFDVVFCRDYLHAKLFCHWHLQKSGVSFSGW